jgi:hypothetical protein
MTTTTVPPLPCGHKQRIAIALCRGPTEVDATVYPPLAIHKPADGGSTWVISHIPTGNRMCCTDTRREARELVAKLLPLDWDVATDGFLSVADGLRRNKLRDRVREIVSPYR